MTTLAPTLSIRYFPRTAVWQRNLLLIVLGALLVAVLAQVIIPLPFTPVPITGQTFAVLLVAGAVSSHGCSRLVVPRRQRIWAGIYERSDAGIPGRVPRGGLRCGAAGRTRPGTKRTHLVGPVPSGNAGHLYFRRWLAGGPVRSRKSTGIGRIPVHRRRCDQADPGCTGAARSVEVGQVGPSRPKAGGGRL